MSRLTQCCFSFCISSANSPEIRENRSINHSVEGRVTTQAMQALSTNPLSSNRIMHDSTPPSYSSLITSQSGSNVLGQGVFEANEVVLNPTDLNLISDNEKRRDFFFKLKNEIAQKVFTRYHYSWRNDGPNDFSKDGYAHECTYSECGGCLISVLTCECCGEVDWVQTTSNQPIPIGIHQFANRIAIGLVYQFQEQIPLFTPTSCDWIIYYFTTLTLNFYFDGDYPGGTPYEMLIYSSQFDDGFEVINTTSSLLLQPLYTLTGSKLTIGHLLSTGIRTAYGGKYEPMNLKNLALFNELKSMNFPLYRWGTKDIENARMKYGIKLKCTESELGGDSKKNEALFWQEAEALAKQYLSSQELASLYP